MARKARTSGRIYLHLAAHLRSGAGPHGPGHKASRRLDRYATEEQLDELDDDTVEFEEEVKFHTERLETIRLQVRDHVETYDLFRYDESFDFYNEHHRAMAYECIDDIAKAKMSLAEEIDWFVQHKLSVPAET